MEHSVEFHFRDRYAKQIYDAIAPETGGEVNARSRAECRMESGDMLVLSVSASDIGALRASLNMWLRLVNVAKEMQEVINTYGGKKI